VSWVLPVGGGDWKDTEEALGLWDTYEMLPVGEQLNWLQ
jgi:hypothetical protein